MTAQEHRHSVAQAAGDLIVRRPQGLYCPPGDFYIDPWRPVDRAVITHAHADHARRGHAHYLAASPGAGVLRSRLGDIDLQTLEYGEQIDHFGVRVGDHGTVDRPPRVDVEVARRAVQPLGALHDQIVDRRGGHLAAAAQ